MPSVHLVHLLSGWWNAKIVWRNNPVLDRSDQERRVTRQVRQMVFAPVAFLEFLEVNEGVVPRIEEEVLPPRFQLYGPYVTAPADSTRATASRNSKGIRSKRGFRSVCLAPPPKRRMLC